MPTETRLATPATSAVNQAIAIRVSGVRKTYGGFGRRRKRALDGVSLEIRRGEVFGLIGPNGAGKTTLMGCLLALLRPEAGQIEVAGRAPDDLWIRERTGYLPERLGFDRGLTGRQFLDLHARLAGVPAAQAPAAIEEGRRRSDLAEEALGRRLSTYSRGMLQRVALAQALLRDPEFLFLDEPTSGMDPTGVALLRRHIQDAKARGATVVLNSHQLPEVERVCDRVAFVSSGHVERLEILQHQDPAQKAWCVGVPSAQEGEARAALQAVGFTVRPNGGLLHVEGSEVERIAPALVAAGVALVELRPVSVQLEALFFNGETGETRA